MAAVPALGQIKPRRWLYHVTRQSNLESILVGGIEPRSGRLQRSSWDPVVFFVRQYRHADEMVRTFWADFLSGNDISRFDRGGMVILTIDPRKMPDAVFYQDAIHPLGVVTRSHVPPGAIIGHKVW